MKLILGLGNPGEQYAKTRHNVGAMVLDALVGRLDLQMAVQSTLHAVVIKHGELVLAKPTTFMNNSGQAARAVQDWYKLNPADNLVVHDDLDVPLGEVRIRLGGGTAGHNGVASVAYHLGTPDFWRVRIGIGPSLESLQLHRTNDTAGFVLSAFHPDELPIANQVIDMVCSWIDTNSLPWEPVTLRVDER